MTSDINILCIIPARSGSKSLPNKNIKNFKGKPLLTWTIEQAKKCSYVNQMKILLSTDSEKYAQIGKNEGAEVPFLRPSEISQDLSTDFEYIKYTVEWLQNNEDYYPDIIIQLRPTQPCRKVADINNALDIFIKNRCKYDSLRSVVLFEKTPYKMYSIDNNNLKPLFDNVNGIKEPYNKARQILPDTYLHNGYIDILNTNILSEGSLSGNVIYPYIMEKEDIIDIDTSEDWDKAILSSNHIC